MSSEYFKKKIANNKGFIIFVVVLILVRWSALDHYRVPTGSMIPTINIGDNIIVNKLAYKFVLPLTEIEVMELGKPQRGDIVVFRYPNDPGYPFDPNKNFFQRGTNFVKRLVGVPGDTLEIMDGILKINGKELFYDDMTRDELVEKLTTEGATNFFYKEKLGDSVYEVQRIPQYARNEYKVIKVPEGKYFFMGDNRDNSADSRIWGFVKEEYIIGQAKRVLFSVSFDDGFFPNFKFNRIGKSIESL